VHGGDIPTFIGILVVVDKDAAIAIEKSAVNVSRPGRIRFKIEK
jgi:hypothetical protein